MGNAMVAYAEEAKTAPGGKDQQGQAELQANNAVSSHTSWGFCWGADVTPVALGHEEWPCWLHSAGICSSTERSGSTP